MNEWNIHWTILFIDFESIIILNLTCELDYMYLWNLMISQENLVEILGNYDYAFQLFFLFLFLNCLLHFENFSITVESKARITDFYELFETTTIRFLVILRLFDTEELHILFLIWCISIVVSKQFVIAYLLNSIWCWPIKLVIYLVICLSFFLIYREFRFGIKISFLDLLPINDWHYFTIWFSSLGEVM